MRLTLRSPAERCQGRPQNALQTPPVCRRDRFLWLNRQIDDTPPWLCGGPEHGWGVDAARSHRLLSGTIALTSQ